MERESQSVVVAFTSRTKINKSFSKILLEKLRFLKNLTGGERGSLSLAAAFFLLVFALFLALSYKKFMMIHLENKQRKTTYLCLKNTLDRYDDLLFFIKRTNLSILAINASLILHPSPYLLKLKEGIQKVQDVKGQWVWTKAITKKDCKGLQKFFPFKAFPLKKKGILIQRHLSGTAQIKDKPFNFKLPSSSGYPFLFFIMGKISFEPSIKLYESREIPLSLYPIL